MVTDGRLTRQSSDASIGIPIVSMQPEPFTFVQAFDTCNDYALKLKLSKYAIRIQWYVLTVLYDNVDSFGKSWYLFGRVWVCAIEPSWTLCRKSETRKVKFISKLILKTLITDRTKYVSNIPLTKKWMNTFLFLSYKGKMKKKTINKKKKKIKKLWANEKVLVAGTALPDHACKHHPPFWQKLHE